MLLPLLYNHIPSIPPKSRLEMDLLEEEEKERRKGRKGGVYWRGDALRV